MIETIETPEMRTYIIEGLTPSGDIHRFRMERVTEEYKTTDEKSAKRLATEAGIEPILNVRLKQ